MTIQFNVYVSKAFDYLSADTHYTVTLEGKKDMHFQNRKTGGGTVLYAWQVEKALNAGWLVKE
jgi:hypothetical protein